jgi:hypothetical protein
MTDPNANDPNDPGRKAGAADLGSSVDVRSALQAVSIVAGGGADDVFQDGTAIDRSNFHDAVLKVMAKATLSGADTAIVTAKLQESADGSTGWTDLTPSSSDSPSPKTIAATGVAEIELNFNLRPAKKFVRCQAKANLSAANTDTCMLSAELVLGDASSGPV